MPPSVKPPDESPEYLVERVRDVLAKDRRVGELELDIRGREGGVRVAGTVVTRQQHEAVPLVLREAFPGLRVENRTELAARDEPEEAERIT
jgi:hypothetical protein